MLKDPNHKAETPYELLGLSPDAPKQEVHQALPRFMRDRRNLPRIGRAQEAVRKLQSPKARAATDILFYSVDVTAFENPQAAHDPPDLTEFRGVAVLPPEELYCDLEGADPAADFREIHFLEPKISDIRSLDGLDEVRLGPRFDR